MALVLAARVMVLGFWPPAYVFNLSVPYFYDLQARALALILTLDLVVHTYIYIYIYISMYVYMYYVVILAVSTFLYYIHFRPTSMEAPQL